MGEQPIGTAHIPSTGDVFGHLIMNVIHESDPVDIDGPTQRWVRMHTVYEAACGKKSEVDEDLKLNWHGDLCRDCWNKFPVIRGLSERAD